MAARKRLPQGFRRTTMRNASPAAKQALLQAFACLYSDTPGPTGDEALAELEQRKREADASRQRQGELVLRGID